MPQFLAPFNFWWLAAVWPAILILYFLRLRRTNRIVSSTLLWRATVRDLRVNAPMQMIRRSLLLFLQLLAAFLFVAALAQPVTKRTDAAGRKAVLILDCSASMGTRDEAEGRTRFEAAQEAALRLVDNLGQVGEGANAADELAVIAAADRPLLLTGGFTNDKIRLREAVRRARWTCTTTDMAEAVEMALGVTGTTLDVAEAEKSLLVEPEEAPPPAGEETLDDMVGRSTGGALLANLIILSDGAFPPIPERLAKRIAGENRTGGVGAGSRYIAFGAPPSAGAADAGDDALGASDNLAVVALDVRTDPTDATLRQLYVRVENYGAAARTVPVTVTWRGAFHDRTWIEAPGLAGGGVGLAPSPGQAGAMFPLPPGGEGVVEAQIAGPVSEAPGAPLYGGDRFPHDDRVVARLEIPSPVRALLVTEGNYFLEQFFRADASRVSGEAITPAQYPDDGRLATGAGHPYEIIVFDRWAPRAEQALPDGPALLFLGAAPPAGALPGLARAAETPTLYAPVVEDWSRPHPLMAGLSLLDRIPIRQCLRLEAEPAWTRVMAGRGLALARAAGARDPARLAAARVLDAPLLLCRTTDERRVAVLAFDILESQWTLRVSFPLFLKNAVHWLARPGGLSRAQAWRTGEQIGHEFTRPIAEATVTAPDGATHPAPKRGERGAYFSGTYEQGLYTMAARDAAGAELAGEKPSFAVNLLSAAESDNRRHPKLELAGRSLGTNPAVERNREWWPWLLAAALAVLLLEWFLFHRRAVS